MRSQTANQPQSDRLAGRVAGVFGLKGEVKVQATTAGASVIRTGAHLRLLTAEDERRLTISSVREHQGRPIVRFDGIGDATSATSLVGAQIFAPREAFVLETGEYLDDDLIGCRVIENGRELGVVRAVEHYPSQDMLVIGKDRVPLVKTFIERIDVGAREISVTLPPGLID